MEILTILLSSLFAVFSPAGLIVDKIIEDSLRSQTQGIEQLAVRVDNAPSYQIIQGKAQQIRIAARGIKVTENIRIETLEVETDPIDVDLDALNQKKINALRKGLEQPLGGGIRLILTEEDINKALQSDEIQSRLEQFVNRAIASRTGSGKQRYKIVDPKIELLGNNRLSVQVELQRFTSSRETSESLNISVELGLRVVAGRTIQFVEPKGTINGRTLSTRLLNGFARGLSRRFDLRSLEQEGIVARLLQLDLESDRIDTAAFIHVEPLTSVSPTQKE